MIRAPDAVRAALALALLLAWDAGPLTAQEPPSEIPGRDFDDPVAPPDPAPVDDGDLDVQVPGHSNHWEAIRDILDRAGPAEGEIVEPARRPIATGTPRPGPSMADFPEVREAYVTFLEEHYTTQAEEWRYRVDTFQWQLLAGKIVFAVVLVIVAGGFYLSCRQVALGWRPSPSGSSPAPPAPAAGEEGGAAPDPAGRHEFEAGFAGLNVKISSPGLGVVILVVSLAFFYLYLVYVYKISEI